jgi:threonyl-tRNA synthetase
MRVRAFVQDDAHLFCSEAQLLPEIIGILKLIKLIMEKCGLSDYHFELSLRGNGKKEYLGDDEEWMFAEKKLEESLVSLGLPVIKKPGEAKFYGPSLDLHVKDIHHRSWQCSSIQLDFNLPRRFDMHYFDENNVRQVPYMLHRAIFGSLERFIGILLENYGKNLPFWMHPVQYKILSVSEDSNDYALEIEKELRQRGYSIELDLSDKILKEKIRRSHDEMIHSLIIVGKKEKEGRVMMVKRMSDGKQEECNLQDLLKI